MVKRAVVLSSGGIDSTTAMAIAIRQGYEVYSLTFRYGQRHEIELRAAQKVSAVLGAKEHMVVDIDLGKIGGSALTSRALGVPKARSKAEMESGIPVTYVPARNTIFLSYALAWAEVLEASHVFIGVNVIDYSGYPDCRPEYIQAFEAMANLAIKATVEGRMRIAIETPLISMTKAEIIRRGVELGIDYAITHSCYDPSGDGRACGVCDSCILRKKGFLEAGIKDPTRYL
ncbi:MAG: 7-cyano-7-deazaguanine synthase [Syntrophorhabdaceae bacterium PtaU1.Bin034]|nr:MAG: 7-cyano-7-deazaguanine synthase [Syntrophorhabdaceae bacterium PtaU1.Bin034]